MKNNSKNELGEIAVETVTVVEKKVPVKSTTIVEETVPVETSVHTNSVPVENAGDSSTMVPNSDNSSEVVSPQVSEPVNNIPSHNNSSDDVAQSKLRENSERSPSPSNIPQGSNNSSSAANRLRNNNRNNPNNRLGRNNNVNGNNGDKGNNNANNNNNTNDKLGKNNGTDGKKNDDKAAQKLLNNKANKARKLPFLNRKKNNKKSDNNQNDNNDSNNSDNVDDNGQENLIKKAKKIKIIASIIIALLPFLLIVLVLVALLSSLGSLLNFFGIVSTGGGGDFPTAMTDNPNEKKYYDKLDSVVASYRTKCGISLNKNYIHAILFYPMQNYDEFFDQDFSGESSSDDVDYNSLAGKVDTVAKLMVDNCSVDYEVGGTSYENIKNSSFFKKYYKDLLEDTPADNVLTSVFDLAEAGTEMFLSNWYINDNLKVVQRTCNTYGYLNGTKDNSTIGFSEYIMGVLYGELDTNLEIIPENKEFLKALVVAATSYALARANYQPGDTVIEVSNGDCWQLSCNLNEVCTYAYDLGTYGTCYTGIQDKVKIDWKRNPISSNKLSLIKEVMEEVFGMVMLDPSGEIKEPQYRDGSCGNDCMGQKPGMVDAQSGMTYQEILEKYYNNFTLSNASEDLYADVNYEEGGYTSNVVYYNQNDYNNKFCGRTDGTIASSGCGVTSMSIVLSTLVDDSFTPPVVMQEAYGMGSCGKGISGTSSSFFKRSAKLHNLTHKAVNKRGDLQTVINSLKSGKSLVIAHMGPGTFTRGGHYIVLARVNSEGKVYVYDCNNPKKNGWYDFNSIIVKQLKGSLHIITKG